MKLLLLSMLMWLGSGTNPEPQANLQLTLTGFWQSTSGNIFYVQDRGYNGFAYKNIYFPDVWQAAFIGYNNMGQPMYRADFYDGYTLVFSYYFIVVSPNQINVFDSRNPNYVLVWTRYNNNNYNNNKGKRQVIPPNNNNKGKRQRNNASKGKRQL